MGQAIAESMRTVLQTLFVFLTENNYEQEVIDIASSGPWDALIHNSDSNEVAQCLNFMRDARNTCVRNADKRCSELGEPCFLCPAIMFAFKMCMHNFASDPSVKDALEWTCRHTPSQVISFRESVTQKIEKLGEHLKHCGKTLQWLQKGCRAAATVSADVNGPLFEKLVMGTKHVDPCAVDLLKNGAQLLGSLPNSRIGTPHEFATHGDIGKLQKSIVSANNFLVNSLKADPHGSVLTPLSVKMSMNTFLYQVQSCLRVH